MSYNTDFGANWLSPSSKVEGMGQNGYKADPAEIRDPMMMNSHFGSGIAAKPYQNNSTSEFDDSGAELHR